MPHASSRCLRQGISILLSDVQLQLRPAGCQGLQALGSARRQLPLVQPQQAQRRQAGQHAVYVCLSDEQVFVALKFKLLKPTGTGEAGWQRAQAALLIDQRLQACGQAGCRVLRGMIWPALQLKGIRYSKENRGVSG